MKKIVSLIVAAVMLLSMCTVSAFAANGPMPTNPESWGGGARIGFSELYTPVNHIVANNLGDGLVVNNEAMPGATYDQATNTLTIKDLDAPDCSLFIWYMGDDFKLNVEGECKLGVIYVVNMFGVYNTNLTVIGTGSLTVNESKDNDLAISIWNEGEGALTKLTVADSVSLRLYSGEESDVIVRSMCTKAAAAEAMTAGGKAMDGVTSEKVFRTEYDEAYVMTVEDVDEEFNNGYIVESKSDPDGKYSAYYWDDEGSRYVSHYVFVEAIGLWVADPSFGGYGPQKSYTKEEFDKEFTFVQTSQPTSIRYATDEREQDRGWSLFKMTKDGEPDEVYGGSPIWGSEGSSRDDPDEYSIYHVTWDGAQGIYVEDEEFPYTTIDADKLESEGYHLVTSEVEEQKHFQCWIGPAPFVDGDDNWLSNYEVMDCKSDPDGVYVRTGESYSTDPQGHRYNEQIIIQKVQYDEATGNYYVNLHDYTSPRIYVDLDKIGQEYSYATETVTKKTEIKYINSDYDFDDYSYAAKLAENDGQLYSVSPYRTSKGETYYSMYKVELRDNGHYYAVKWDPQDSRVYGKDFSEEEFADEGYSYVMSDQDTKFTYNGDVNFEEMKKYTDAEGKEYAADWEKTVYAYDEPAVTVTFGDTTYTMAHATDIKADNLISSERQVETDMFNYFLKGDEYVFEGSGQEASVFVGDVNLSGAVDNRDAMILDRYVAEWAGYGARILNMDAADLDRKGDVNNRDAMILDRVVAGWTGYYDKYCILV